MGMLGVTGGEVHGQVTAPGQRGPAYLESVYLFGTPDEIVASLQARVDAGVEYFFLHTMTPDPAQLQLWVDEIIPNVMFPPTVGPVRRPPSPWRR